MHRIRIFALGIVSFIAVLMSALLAPGTFVNRALSAALCTVFSFNSTICTVNLAQSGDRVVAATPPAVERNIGDWLVRDPGEFDDAPSVPSGSNPLAPPFPQDPGPNQPVRPDFDNAIQDASDQAAADVKGREVYSFYINGIQTDRITYENTKPLVEKLLNSAGVNPPKLYTDMYNFSSKANGRLLEETADKMEKINRERNSRLPNPIFKALTVGVILTEWEEKSRSFVADLMESLVQTLSSNVATPDGQSLVKKVTDIIQKIDREEGDKAKKSCEKSPKSKFLIIAHSQGNYFANEIGANLPKDIAKRTAILGFSTFTGYLEAKRQGVRVKAISRSNDISTLPFQVLQTLSKNLNLPTPIISNLPSLKKVNNRGEFDEASMIENHSLPDYLGAATNESYKEAANKSFSLASTVLKDDLMNSIDSGYYEKKKECSQQVEQTPQPQQTAQKPSITVTITGQNVIAFNEKLP
ncbi:hypothetical protein [Microcoleus sp. B4-D4]|uniref:hypothetical protein n=1 Tax=Microcoleus sp. B4-D4 TaxID=2818667 RepID=UPI002FD147B3